MAACDAFCELTERRVEDALLELGRRAGTELDPAIVEALGSALATRGEGGETFELWRPDHLLGSAR